MPIRLEISTGRRVSLASPIISAIYTSIRCANGLFRLRTNVGARTSRLRVSGDVFLIRRILAKSYLAARLRLPKFSTNFSAGPGRLDLFKPAGASITNPNGARAADTSENSYVISGMPHHILIVDDDPSLSRALRRCLETYGYRATAETTAHQALSAIENDPIDGVVTDFRLPGMNGIEMLERLRERFPALPAVIYSSCTDGFANLSGKTVVLNKPVECEDIVEALQKLIISSC